MHVLALQTVGLVANVNLQREQFTFESQVNEVPQVRFHQRIHRTLHLRITFLAHFIFCRKVLLNGLQ